jgi:hypothetical protein
MEISAEKLMRRAAVPSAAEAVIQDVFIAALKRCATQKRRT